MFVLSFFRQNKEEEEKRYVCPFCLEEGYTDTELSFHIPLRHRGSSKLVVRE
jgi:hypothetical protein